MPGIPHSHVSVLRLRSSQIGVYEGLLLHLDPEARRARFLAPVGDGPIREHVRGLRTGAVVVLGAFLDGHLRGAAELHPMGQGATEAAFVVEPAYQHQGIGTALVEGAVLVARNRGYRAMRVVCVPTNTAMRALAARTSAELRITFDEVQGSIALPLATPISCLREAVANAFAGMPMPGQGRWRAPLIKGSP